MVYKHPSNMSLTVLHPAPWPKGVLCLPGLRGCSWGQHWVGVLGKRRGALVFGQGGVAGANTKIKIGTFWHHLSWPEALVNSCFKTTHDATSKYMPCDGWSGISAGRLVVVCPQNGLDPVWRMFSMFKRNRRDNSHVTLHKIHRNQVAPAAAHRAPTYPPQPSQYMHIGLPI